MSFPKYYVTYCVMDTDAGANPLGHSCLLFSQQESEQSPVEVMDCIGLYSQPSTTTNPLVKGLKQLIGFKVDLQDGHGILKQELMRELTGNGLHGISFAINQQQFVAISTNYQQMMKTEQEVIKELNLELSRQGIEANGYTRFIAEKAKTKAEGRLPRLKPFHVTLKLTLDGFDSTESYTCKDLCLELLMRNKIISEEMANQIINSKATAAFPRFSALSLPSIRLISTGESEKTVSKRTGEVFYNHVWGKNSLFWASPIHTTDHTTEKKSLNESAEINKKYRSMKEILNYIPQIEYLLRKRMNEVEKEQGQNKEQLSQLNIQLKRVQNISFLFNNTNENQIPHLLEEKLLKANKILNIAHRAMIPDRLNYSFLLRAYESVVLHEALVGMLAMAISAAALLFITPVGVGLLVASTVCTARQLHGFYREEITYSEMNEDYKNWNLARTA